MAPVTEHLTGEDLQRAFQVGKCDALIYQQPLKLIEGMAVGGIYRIAAIASAGRYDPHRRLLLLHDPYLHGRSLATQQYLVADVERVLLIHGRVVFRIVERLEAVVVVLNLGPLGDHEAQSQENLDHLFHSRKQRMLVADGRHASRQRHIQRLGLQFLLLSLLGQCTLAALHQPLQSADGLV